jgi:hypothetical protein
MLFSVIPAPSLSDYLRSTEIGRLSPPSESEFTIHVTRDRRHRLSSPLLLPLLPLLDTLVSDMFPPQVGTNIDLAALSGICGYG